MDPNRLKAHYQFQPNIDALLWGQVKAVSQKLDSLVGQTPIKVSPGKLILDSLLTSGTSEL